MYLSKCLHSKSGSVQAREQRSFAVHGHDQGAGGVGAPRAVHGRETLLREEAREAIPPDHRRAHG